MRRPIFLGEVEVIERIKLTTVWLDKAGMIGVTVAVSTTGFILQIGNTLYQDIPFEHLEIFKETVECLGDL